MQEVPLVARPFTLAQHAENRAVLDILAETGNARLAAREIGRKPSTMHTRRGANAAFAQDWDAAVAAAHARFHLAGGKRGPEADLPRGKGGLGPSTSLRTGRTQPGPSTLRPGSGQAKLGTNGVGKDERPSTLRLRSGQAKLGRNGEVSNQALRTRGHEPVVVRTRSGKLQLRLAHPGKLTRAAEQAFLSALSATANVRLSAAAAGASARAFYRRRRQDKAFAREMRLALKMGYERLECALLTAGMVGSHEHDQWRQSEQPPIPPMSVEQVLQLLFLHEKSVRQSWDEPHRRRRRGEPWEVYRERLAAMWASEKEREAEDAALRRAERFEATGSWRHADEPEPPALPPLELVTGWSKASGRPPHKEGVALFGGWRIAEMERKLRGER